MNFSATVFFIPGSKSEFRRRSFFGKINTIKSKKPFFFCRDAIAVFCKITNYLVTFYLITLV